VWPILAAQGRSGGCRERSTGGWIHAPPSAAGEGVVFKFSPDALGYEFLTKARAVIESAGFNLRYEVFGEYSA